MARHDSRALAGVPRRISRDGTSLIVNKAVAVLAGTKSKQRGTWTSDSNRERPLSWLNQKS
jgi:hypothetical protein